MKRRSDADDTSSNKRQTVQYDATYERIKSCKASLGDVISDECWAKTITEMRWHGSRAFCDYLLFAVVTKRVIFETQAQLKNAIRAYYIIHT